MIADTFIKRPITAIVISIVIVLVGIIALTTLPVAQYPDITPPTVTISGNFLGADDSPWELLMATGLIYALPPAAIYYTFKRYMVSGLTAGAVKS